MDQHTELATLLAQRGAIEEQIDKLQHEHADLEQRISHAKRYMSRMTLPCWECPHGDEARFWLSGNSDPDAIMSPGGLPLNCCRVRSNTLPPTAQISGLRHVST
jgi:hypothetical protein